MRLLIVDDSPHVHIQVKIFLNEAGYEDLLFAASAQEAFSLLGIGKGADNPQPVDLILMDIEMDGMNGIQATAAIKKHKAFEDVPIIIVTGDTSPGSLEKAFLAGAVDYINKPFQKVEFLARIKSFLKLKHETDIRKKRDAEKEELIVELKDALENIKTLRGLLPICSKCKKIRDDKGYWNQIEKYIVQHSEAVFSHGVCPECSDALYGHEEWYIKMKKEEQNGG